MSSDREKDNTSGLGMMLLGDPQCLQKQSDVTPVVEQGWTPAQERKNWHTVRGTSELGSGYET